MTSKSANISERFEVLMHKCDVSSIYALSKVVQIGQSTLATIIKRDAISRIIAEKIAEATKCSIDWLLTGEGDPFPPAVKEPIDPAFYESMGLQVRDLYEATATSITHTPGEVFVLPKGFRCPPKSRAVCIMDDSFNPEFAMMDHIIVHPLHPDVTNDGVNYLVESPQGVFITPIYITSGGWRIKGPDGLIFVTEITQCYKILYTVSKYK